MKRGKTEWEYPMPEELNSPGAEYTPLPDEFLQGGGKKTNEPEKKRNRRMRRMYGMTAAFVLAGRYAVCGTGVIRCAGIVCRSGIT